MTRRAAAAAGALALAVLAGAPEPGTTGAVDDATAGPVHSSAAYPQDEAMRRCLHALATVEHLPLHTYRMSCAPTLVHGSSSGATALVGGNTYRDSPDVVVATYLSDAAFVRVIQHEAAHAYLLENPPVRAALAQWARTPDPVGAPGDYRTQPFEVFAAAWARCHGGGPDPVIDDARMTCAQADAIAAGHPGGRVSAPAPR